MDGISVGRRGRDERISGANSSHSAANSLGSLWRQGDGLGGLVPGMNRDGEGGNFVHDYEGRQAVVVDRHPLWLEAVVPVLRELHVEVVGKTTSAEVGLRLVRELAPDLLITGIT